MKNKFLVLWFIGLVGAASVLPYAFTLQREVIAKTGQPLWVIVLASLAQTGVLLTFAIFFGLKLSQRVGLPIFTFFSSGKPIKQKLPGFIKLTAFLGTLTGVLIIVGDRVFGRFLPELTVANSKIAAWKTLLASLYGGVVEEILLRLFCLSLLVWVLAKIIHIVEPVKNNIIMWSAIILSSVLFGLGHLPITAALTTITPLVVVRAILLNGIGGLVFGWLYWKKGLEFSMATHFTADIVILFLFPMLLR
ncbi:MAG: CPBP family intramembrane metalloprotease [Candidatus Doudnabacteria bacterium]|nr:CPBP family intramembrane metalloprotease [Candidatus Doudnabacteria bacterium]